MTFPGISEVTVKGRVIGGGRPSVCVPLVAPDRQGLLAEATAVSQIRPDIVEWRVDYYNAVEDPERIKEALHSLREILPHYPLIFTCRAHSEGGYREIGGETRVALIKEIIRTGRIDMVDIELETGRETIQGIVAEARKYGVYVIVSSHDFKKTPPREEMVARLLRAQDLGADMVKIAVMPAGPQDVLDLLAATLEFRQNHARVPAITMSMSGQGVISRVAGFLYGSTVTFAAGKEASAPGQIPIAKLRAAIEILEKAL